MTVRSLIREITFNIQEEKGVPRHIGHAFFCIVRRY